MFVERGPMAPFLFGVRLLVRRPPWMGEVPKTQEQFSADRGAGTASYCPTRPTGATLEDALGKLHRHAMQAAVLEDQRLAIDADHFVIGEAGLELIERNPIRRIAVGWY